MPPDNKNTAENSADIQKLKEQITAQQAEVQDALSELKDTQADVCKQVDAYTLEVAGRRGYERTVGLVMTVGAALAIGVGVLFSFLGLKELDDFKGRVDRFEEKADATERRLDNEIDRFTGALTQQIDQQIDVHFLKTQDEIADYEAQAAQTDALIAKLKAAEIRWQELKPALDGLDGYDRDSDIKGDFLALIDTSRTPPASREEKVGIVLRISAHLREAEQNPDATIQFTPDDIFNAAQMARSLSRVDLERELVQAAYDLDNSSMATQAQYLQLQTRLGPVAERDALFAELLNFVGQLTLNSPHIVLAEVWNAAEEQRRYTEFLQAIDARILAAQTDPDVFLPSFIYTIKANAHQRRGLPNELQIALASYVRAIDRLAREGTHTQWADATIRDTLEGVEQLLLSGVDISAILRAAKRSNIPELNVNLAAMLGNFMEQTATAELSRDQ